MSQQKYQYQHKHHPKTRTPLSFCMTSHGRNHDIFQWVETLRLLQCKCVRFSITDMIKPSSHSLCAHIYCECPPFIICRSHWEMSSANTLYNLWYLMESFKIEYFIAHEVVVSINKLGHMTCIPTLAQSLLDRAPSHDCHKGADLFKLGSPLILESYAHDHFQRIFSYIKGLTSQLVKFDRVRIVTNSAIFRSIWCKNAFIKLKVSWFIVQEPVEKYIMFRRDLPTVYLFASTCFYDIKILERHIEESTSGVLAIEYSYPPTITMAFLRLYSAVVERLNLGLLGFEDSFMQKYSVRLHKERGLRVLRR